MPATPLELARRADEVVAHLRRFDVWVPSVTGAAVDAISHEVEDLAPVTGDPRYYRLFTFRRGSAITGRVLLDARDATVLEVQGVPDISRTLPPFVDPLDVLRHALPTASTAGAPAPSLVWKYSAESTSRFRPFWFVTANQLAWYVRVDGAIFTTLTQFVPSTWRP